MKAKDKHKAKLIKYMSDWGNPFPNRTQMANVLGLKLTTLNFHFSTDEQNAILNEGLEARKKNSAIPRSEIYEAMQKAGKDGVVPAQKEFLDRTEGKVVERHEHTGKDGKELFPSLPEKEKAILAGIFAK
jgi:hypothetical protein